MSNQPRIVMRSFPSEFLTVLVPYAGLFCRRVFAHVQLLLAGAILAPGKRTITSVLRIVGLSQERAFHKYHRVLSHAPWSARLAARVLLRQLVAVFAPAGPVVLGLDETLERRLGAAHWRARALPRCGAQQPRLLCQMQRLTLEEARLEVAWYLDTYFNLDRRHSALGYRSPHQFEHELKTNLP